MDFPQKDQDHQKAIKRYFYCEYLYTHFQHLLQLHDKKDPAIQNVRLSQLEKPALDQDVERQPRQAALERFAHSTSWSELVVMERQRCISIFHRSLAQAIQTNRQYLKWYSPLLMHLRFHPTGFRLIPTLILGMLGYKKNTSLQSPSFRRVI